MVLGLGVGEEGVEGIEGAVVHDTNFENGALKKNNFRMMDEGACEWLRLYEWELTQVDELVHICKAARYIEELDMHIVFTETFLARRVH
jgi:hypothetical protein